MNVCTEKIGLDRVYVVHNAAHKILRFQQATKMYSTKQAAFISAE
jgi:hypothetical protein